MDAAVHNQARRLAERSAMRLITFADAVWPDAKISSLIIEEIMHEAVVFAVHARRILDAERLDREIEQSHCTTQNFGKSGIIEESLRSAANALIPAIELRVWQLPSERIIYRDCNNIQFAGLLAKTDRSAARLIDTRGMAWAYLTLPLERANEEEPLSVYSR